MGMSIGIDRVIERPWFKNLAPRIMKKPKVYFIQVGFEAKLKSLNVIEILRKAHVPVAQSLSKDSLGAQLAVAEKSGAPYVIIFGQKEAVEQSVIVRNMETRSQDTVPLSELSTYIKQLK
jgi:histidyl-tRNA synthetase